MELRSRLGNLIPAHRLEAAPNGPASALHLNIARVWIFGVDNLPISGSLYLAGFSLTLKNPH